MDTKTSLPTRLAPAVALLLLLCSPVRAVAQDARVIWVRDSLVYLAASDSFALWPGDRLSFREGREGEDFDRVRKRKEIAAAEVTARLDPLIRAARLTSGSLARVRRLERLSVRAHGPSSVTSPTRLRLGIPSARRVNPLFACSTVTFSPSQRYGYRADSAWANRWLNDGTLGKSWPETLVVTSFDDAADQEIALERGEVDAGIFWPGELSARMRNDVRWGRPILGRPHRGYLAVFRDSGRVEPPASLAADLDAINQRLFRGDLFPLGVGAAQPTTPGIRYVVDASIPGRQTLERILNHSSPTPGPVGRVVYRDEVNTYYDPDFRPLFEVRYAVIASPDAQQVVVHRIGADSLAGMLKCAVVR